VGIEHHRKLVRTDDGSVPGCQTWEFEPPLTLESGDSVVFDYETSTVIPNVVVPDEWASSLSADMVNGHPWPLPAYVPARNPSRWKRLRWVSWRVRERVALWICPWLDEL